MIRGTDDPLLLPSPPIPVKVRPHEKLDFPSRLKLTPDLEYVAVSATRNEPSHPLSHLSSYGYRTRISVPAHKWVSRRSRHLVYRLWHLHGEGGRCGLMG